MYVMQAALRAGRTSWPARLAYAAVCTVLGAVPVALTADAAAPPAAAESSFADAALRGYFAGNGLLQRGLWALAEGEYRGFLAAHPAHEKAPLARYGLAVSLFRQGKPAEALVELNAPRAGAEVPFPAEAATMAGQCHLSAQAYDEAAAAFDEVRRTHPDHELADEAAAGACEALYLGRRFAEALVRCGELVTRFPGSPLRERGGWFAGLAATASGDYTAAAAHLTAVIEQYPSGEFAGRARYQRARVRFEQGNYEAALADFQAVAGESATGEDAAYWIAKCRLRLGDSAGAARLLEEVAAGGAAEGRPTVLYDRAVAQIRSGGAEAGVASLREFLVRFPTHELAPPARRLLGMTLYGQERFTEAEEALLEGLTAVEFGPETHVCHFALGDISFAREDWPAAERHLRAFLEGGADASPADEALLKLGLAQARQGRHDDALASFGRLLERFTDSPHRLQALFERGQSLLAQERWDVAAETFERVLAEGGDSRFRPFALRSLAAIAMQRKDFSGAAERFAALGGDAGGNGGDLAYQRGVALLGAGRYAEANEVLTRFAEANPDHAQAPAALGQAAIARARQEQCDKALEAIELGARRFGGVAAFIARLDEALRPAVQYEQAWCLRKTGRTQDAATAYRAVLEAPGPGELRSHAALDLAALEMDARHFEPALPLLKAVLEGAAGDPPTARALREQAAYRAGLCSFELGRFNDAVGHFTRFLKEFPTASTAASAGLLCGESLLRMGRHAEAITPLSDVATRFANDPACGTVLLRLGECHAALQQWARSEEVLTDYLERFGGSEAWYQAQFGVGWARENQGRLEEAIRAYEVVVARHQGPTAARAQFQIGECLFAKKEFEAAARELLKADILYAYPEWSAAALFEAGRCFEAWGKPGEARQQFQAVVQRHGDSRWAGMARARLSQQSNSAIPGR
ncbi:MAG: tetratricopeptide repeat protein [Planctomycetes bacterium]|nr:tetratricopeptide repeat protein [Planctomycetota bacterium]